MCIYLLYRREEKGKKPCGFSEGSSGGVEVGLGGGLRGGGTRVTLCKWSEICPKHKR